MDLDIAALEALESEMQKPKLRETCLRHPPECRLLALPGEIRNTIYRHAAVEPDSIAVVPGDYRQPSILRVCRSVRKEAGSIYFSENVFNYHVRNLNGAMFSGFKRIRDRFRGSAGAKNTGTILLGGPDWDNLVAWIKAEHFKSYGFPIMVMNDDDEPDDWVADGAIKLSEALNGLDWAVKEAALKAYCRGLRGTDSAFVKSEDRINF